MTYDEIKALAASVGFPDPALAAAIAMAESHGNPCARGDPNIGPDCSDYGNATSLGLWQVHFTVHTQYDPMSLFDPAYNAEAALAISSGGVNWKPWSTAWENPDAELGYLGPGAPYRRYYHAGAGSAASAGVSRGMGILLAVATLGGIWLAKRLDAKR